MSLRNFLAVALTGALLGAGAAQAAQIDPAEMLGLRQGPVTGGATILLGFSAVKSGTEDRTIAHFDIGGLGSWTSATLNIGLGNIDPGPPDGTLDLYAFAGDGTVSTDEWAAGSLVSSFTNIPGNFSTLQYDISGLLNTAIGAGDSYLSFRMSTTGLDRFSLNHTTGGTTTSSSGEDPTFIDLVTPPAIPLPAAGWLLLGGLGAIAGLRRAARR